MKKKNLFALTLGALMISSSLTACGSAPAENTGGEELPKLVVATHAEFPPYEFYQGGEPVGIDLDIMAAVCEKLGYELEVTDMAFGSIIPSVETGKADVGAAAITKTEDRAKSINFTDSYATGIQSVIVKKDGPVASLADLKGEDVIIGVQQDTTGDIYGTKEFGEAHMLRFSKGVDAVQALMTGKCSAVIIDNGPAETFVGMNEDLVILPEKYEEEDYCYVISYDEPELYEAVNGALQELIADGTIQTIIDGYITAE